jgi:hypothetical protein
MMMSYCKSAILDALYLLSPNTSVFLRSLRTKARPISEHKCCRLNSSDFLYEWIAHVPFRPAYEWRISRSENWSKPPAYATSLGKYFSFLIVLSYNFLRFGKTSTDAPIRGVSTRSTRFTCVWRTRWSSSAIHFASESCVAAIPMWCSFVLFSR